ncbi:poly-beta-1,6-N-acetyl-D-glucosamine synthase [Lysobacter claricitrinus]|uniref:poly-beta-1,6-N-acetyl-D-glucosamine synthase n=1 Tax=Lysobacter claricitrinus TaxID=3367728 RepID=UPI0037DABBAD
MSSPLQTVLGGLCFGYPYVATWYWVVGGLLFHLLRERAEPPYDQPPMLANHPPVSILVPCHNEARQLDETFAALKKIDYPDFEIVAINDGSTDATATMLDAFAASHQRLRVIHLARNAGKAMALNVGALAARHELLVCIDGDTLLDAHAVTWFVRRFQNDAQIGALTGNPRIRNRTSLIGRLQVGEFSGIVGLIKRAQNIYGGLFTVSGAVCAFRKRALHDAGWWTHRTLTDDVDVTWRVQLAGWRAAFEPKALAWILTPETLRGLWQQRLRWSEGGSRVALDSARYVWHGKGLRMLPIWLNWLVAQAWAYTIGLMLVAGALHRIGIDFGFGLKGLGWLPHTAGLLLAVHYLTQALVAAGLDRRYEPRALRSVFWVVWYPVVFWMLQATTAMVGLPRAILRRDSGRWTSPDRGYVE